MLDIKWIRQNQEKFNSAMKKRSNDTTSYDLIKIDDKRKQKIEEIQILQNKRNELAKKIAISKKSGEDSSFLMSESVEINKKLKNLSNDGQNNDQSEKELQNILQDILSELPNIPDEDVPIGEDENDNIEIEKWGDIPKFDFTPKEHFEIGENLNIKNLNIKNFKMLDFEQSALISGARFSTLSGDLAKLERVLANFMIDFAVENKYIEVSPPNLVKDNAMFGSGQLPKFKDEAFKTTNDYWLIPTAEVPLVNLVRNKILEEDNLPLRFVAYTPCFRSEAGSAGKDTRGMIRQHQFKKVELVSITNQEDSKSEHERMTDISIKILQKLKIPYRKMLLCSKDMGFTANKTYDLEVWLPGQNKYREVSSCSNCGDFQARRMGAKYRSKDYKNSTSKQSIFVHTLNGSALAIGRTMVAILENYQNEDGSINIPEILIESMGKDTIGKDIIR